MSWDQPSEQEVALVSDLSVEILARVVASKIPGDHVAGVLAAVAVVIVQAVTENPRDVDDCAMGIAEMVWQGLQDPADHWDAAERREYMKAVAVRVGELSSRRGDGFNLFGGVI